jgi:hypothetical protein
MEMQQTMKGLLAKMDANQAEMKAIRQTPTSKYGRQPSKS